MICAPCLMPPVILPLLVILLGFFKVGYETAGQYVGPFLVLLAIVMLTK